MRHRRARYFLSNAKPINLHLFRSASVDCNIDQCAKSTKVYEELGCKAVFGSRSCCAKRFDCPDFQKLDDNTCTHEGQEYRIGESLPRNRADNTKCLETCFCTRSACSSSSSPHNPVCCLNDSKSLFSRHRQDNAPAKFTCTDSDCGISSLDVPGCISVYGDLNECCSTSIVCGE